MRSRQLVAFNTATESDNKIHDDDVARRFGFSGGLVPGVDVYGYLSWGPASVWGLDWLTRGTMAARFSLPTYDGERVTVEFDETSGACRVRNPAGVVVSEGVAACPEDPTADPDAARYPWAPLTEVRPPASEASLVSGQVLGSYDVTFHADRVAPYLTDVREELDIYAREKIAHPGWVLRLANYVLARNVVLGPWIHVGSSVTNHRVIRDGAQVSCRGRVAREYEHKGHRFVQLDLVIWADDAPAASIDHTAIYLPRQVRERAAATG